MMKMLRYTILAAMVTTLAGCDDSSGPASAVSIDHTRVEISKHAIQYVGTIDDCKVYRSSVKEGWNYFTTSCTSSGTQNSREPGVLKRHLTPEEGSRTYSN